MDLHLDVQKRTVAAVSAAMNAHDAERYAALFAADPTIHEYGLGDAGGRAAIARGLQRALDGFPDLAVGVGDVFASEDVVVLWVITGTNRGELNGAKPTGKPDGLIATERRYWDTSTWWRSSGCCRYRLVGSRPCRAASHGGTWREARPRKRRGSTSARPSRLRSRRGRRPTSSARWRRA